MVKMVEVTGSSGKSFSDAVKIIINKLTSPERKAHFFEVLEQKGVIRENNVKEFQVKLRVALETEEEKEAQEIEKEVEEERENICPTCLRPVGEEGHLCSPIRKDQKCEWCGAIIVNQRHLCEDKLKEVSYICNSCGRTAIRPDFLCNPKEVNSTGK